MPTYILTAKKEDVGRRLDLVIFDYFSQKKLGLSRSFIQKLILSQKVKINNLTSVKPSYKVKLKDEIEIFLEETKEEGLIAENIPLEVIYEDKYLAIINKPSGLVVHPAVGNPKHTLVNALLYHFKNLSQINSQRPGIVHRLDKETSGLLVVAKDNATHLELAKQFAKHSIKRKYVALVKGRMEFDEGTIELPLSRHPYKRKNIAVSFKKEAKYAKTYYRTLKRKKDFSFLELEPFTGRTHQLRVHLAYLGHPILGDTKYGKDKTFGRLALHAKYLGFIHPGLGKFVEFSSDLPLEFLRFLTNDLK